MNILISTTTNWNPGDDFIRYGVKNLLDSIYFDINYIHYDRNPDYFESGLWEMGHNHKSNVMNDPIDWSVIDVVVLAGSPEFLGGPLKPLYEGLAENPHIPLLLIGVGYSHEVDNLVLSHEEFLVLSRPENLIIVRQYDLQEKLNELLEDCRTVNCLPCPAIFASFRDYRGDQFNKLVIRQAPIGLQALDKKDYHEMIGEAKTSDTCLFHYIEDFKYFNGRGYFSTEARDLLLKIIQYKEVVSNRLHGGIVALGAGSKVKIINSSNRVQKALEPYKPYLKDGFYEMTLDEVNEVKGKYTKLIEEYL